jgi:hypothetical protein
VGNFKVKILTKFHLGENGISSDGKVGGIFRRKLQETVQIDMLMDFT